MIGVIWLVIIGSSVWVGFDAKNLGAKRGVLGGGFLDSSAIAWFFGCLLFWIIVLPAYLVARPKFVAAKAAREWRAPSAPSAAHAPMLFPAPPAGTWPGGPANWPAAPMPTVATPAPRSVTAELGELHALHQSGALSVAEFESLKQDLLQR